MGFVAVFGVIVLGPVQVGVIVVGDFVPRDLMAAKCGMSSRHLESKALSR